MVVENVKGLSIYKYLRLGEKEESDKRHAHLSWKIAEFLVFLSRYGLGFDSEIRVLDLVLRMDPSDPVNFTIKNICLVSFSRLRMDSKDNPDHIWKKACFREGLSVERELRDLGRTSRRKSLRPSCAIF